MAGFSEPEDAYAADGEGAATAAHRLRRQRSMRNREFGLYATRLRQRPRDPTKQDDASELSGPGTTTPRSPNPHTRTSRHYRSHGDLNGHFRSSLDDSAPQLPPLPLSPTSPRWASLASSSSIVYNQTTPTITPAPSSPTSPTQATRPSSQATSLSSSRFPGLSSHPYLPQPPTPERTSPTTREFPTPEKRHDTQAAIASSSALNSPTSRPSSSKEAGGGTMMVENFSRPRKPSVRQYPYDSHVSRLRQPDPVQFEPVVSQSSWPRDRARGLSLSSNKSSTTQASPSKRPSNDHLRTGRPATTTTSSSTAASGGIISPGLPRPPLAYSRVDSSTPNPGTNHRSHSREALPWMVDEELRSSYRSQLTASTTQGTLFTPSGTERSSVLTKTSSRTSASLFAPGGLAADEGLSVEDVMGMYEKGFYSTGGEDNDMDIQNEDGNRDSGDMDYDDSRPGTSTSEASRIGNRLLEAMSEPLPLPTKALPIPRHGPHVVRDSGAFFRNSGLPYSLPKDVGLGLASETKSARRGREPKEVARDKRDSVLDHDDRYPMRHQYSARSALTQVPSAGAAPPTSIAADAEPDADAKELPRTESIPPALHPVVSEDDDPDSKDRYGFRKKNQYINREQYDEWNKTYSEYLARRRKKWAAYLKDSGLMTDNPNRFPPPSPKTKRFIRKGIPPEWRGAAWFYYAQGPSILAKHPGEYDALVQKSESGGAKDIDVEAIERDLHRTFPDNVKFKWAGRQPGIGDTTGDECKSGEPGIISSLRRVLLAFSIYNPRIGYCQSLNFLAGLLLLFVETEEQCFWLLNVITRLYLPGTHETSLEGSKVDLGVLMAALKDSMPGVWAKVGGELEDIPSGEPVQPVMKHGTLGRKSKRSKPSASRSTDALGTPSVDRLPPITLCMTAWFMSCFIGTLPIETTLRVWDVFFYEGSKTLFRVALGIFKLGEAEIRSVADPMEMFGIVQAIPRRLLDCNMVIDATFRRRNGFGHISQESIEEQRKERKDELKAVRVATTAMPDIDVNSRVSGDIADITDVDAAVEIRSKGTLFGRRKERRAVEVM